jgi:hypothetical protein
MINLVSTAKGSDKFYVKCRIKFYKCENPAIYITIQKQMPVSYRKLSKIMIDIMKQRVFVLQMLLSSNLRGKEQSVSSN